MKYNTSKKGIHGLMLVETIKVAITERITAVNVA